MPPASSTINVPHAVGARQAVGRGGQRARRYGTRESSPFEFNVQGYTVRSDCGLHYDLADQSVLVCT